jgi:VanZ family protein
LNFREIIKAWLPVFLWMALMFFGSSDLMSAEHTSRILTPLLRWWNPDISPAAVAQVHFFVRKAAHIAEYAILAVLLCRALRDWIEEFWRRVALTLAPALIPSVVRRFTQRIVRRCPARLQRRASRYDDLRDDLETEFDMGMNRNFAVATEEDLAPAPQSSGGTQHCSFFRSNPVSRRAAWSRLTA